MLIVLLVGIAIVAFIIIKGQPGAIVAPSGGTSPHNAPPNQNPPPHGHPRRKPRGGNTGA